MGLGHLNEKRAFCLQSTSCLGPARLWFPVLHQKMQPVSHTELDGSQTRALTPPHLDVLPNTLFRSFSVDLSINFKSVSTRVRMSGDSHPRFGKGGAHGARGRRGAKVTLIRRKRALWRRHSIPVCGYSPEEIRFHGESVRCEDVCQSSPFFPLAAAGCFARLLITQSSDATGADGGLPWRERGNLHLEAFDSSHVCVVISVWPRNKRAARSKWRFLRFWISHRSGVLSSNFNTPGCFCGRLPLCPPVQRDSAGCMEGCRHGLHQENQNFGVHMRNPERHDQHRLSALCRMGH